MKRSQAMVSLVVLFSMLGCTARHVVIERDEGQVDSAGSTTSASDLDWNIRQEPAAATATATETSSATEEAAPW